MFLITPGDTVALKATKPHPPNNNSEPHPPNHHSEPHPPSHPSEPHPPPAVIRTQRRHVQQLRVQDREGPGDPSSRVAKNHTATTADHTSSEDSHLNDDVPSNQETDEDLLIAALQRLDVTTPRTTVPPTLVPPTAQEATPSDLDCSTQLYEYQSPPRSAGVRQSAGVGPIDGGRGPQLEDDFIGEFQHETQTTSDVSGLGKRVLPVSLGKRLSLHHCLAGL